MIYIPLPIAIPIPTVAQIPAAVAVSYTHLDVYKRQVLAHAVSDALLGAAALGDIGRLFPDNDPKYEGADSIELLRQVCVEVYNRGYAIENIDATVIAQAPKLKPYIEQMRNNLAQACKININQINVKATTEEHLGFTGRKEGIAVHAVCLIK